MVLLGCPGWSLGNLCNLGSGCKVAHNYVFLAHSLLGYSFLRGCKVVARVFCVILMHYYVAARVF